MHSVRPVSKDERAEEDGHPDDDERVGEIERWPRDEIEEVRHVPEAYTVDQVGDAPAEDESERDRKHRMTASRACEEPEHEADRDGRHGNHERRPAREEPERDPGVLDMVDGERPDDVDAVAER